MEFPHLNLQSGSIFQPAMFDYRSVLITYLTRKNPCGFHVTYEWGDHKSDHSKVLVGFSADFNMNSL